MGKHFMCIESSNDHFTFSFKFGLTGSMIFSSTRASFPMQLWIILFNGKMQEYNGMIALARNAIVITRVAVMGAFNLEK